jgi:hypothetical protein
VTALDKLAHKVAQPGSASLAAEVILNIGKDGLSFVNHDKSMSFQHAEQAA